MADFYKVLKADPMGEPWTPNVPNAKALQNYWCQVEGQDKAVMIGKQVRDDGQPALTPGQQVYGNLLYAKSQKGTEYWKFKSEKVPDGVTRPASTPAQATAQAAVGVVGDAIPQWAVPLYNMTEYIYKEMRKMDDNPPVEVASPMKAEPKKVEQVAGEPIDEDTQATLDAIFGEPETPDDIPEE